MPRVAVPALALALVTAVVAGCTREPAPPPQDPRRPSARAATRSSRCHGSAPAGSAWRPAAAGGEADLRRSAGMPRPSLCLADLWERYRLEFTRFQAMPSRRSGVAAGWLRAHPVS